MRKAYGRPGPLYLLVAASALTIGCKQDFVDDQFGVLDLASTFDGGTSTDPSAGVPDQIDPTLGYVDGAQAEYYNFGSIPVQRDPFTGTPQVATVRPMYFFFDLSGHPLFSAPVREQRDGVDWMKGGIGVLNPNPKDYCAGVPKDQQATNPCKKKADDEKKKPYALRFREPWKDRLRGVNDYQRPIIDVTPADRSVSNNPYTGLWEIIEVIVANGYVPDSIKHESTLDKAIAAGKANSRPTGKIINCPMVDERTLVAPGVADRATPHPRIELWYRRQLAFCYLANGWETLGNEKGELFSANSDGDRVQTFDVAKVAAGEGAVRTTKLVVPISKVFNPAILTDDQSGAQPSFTRVVDNALSQGVPRRTNGDPPGYSPIRWMWDFIVENDYQAGGLDSVAKLDPSASTSTSSVRNMPLRGTRVKCGYMPQPTKGNRCGKLIPDPDDPAMMKLEPRGDEVCTAQGLECNPDSCFCDAPFVGYGQVCGPGIAQCDPGGDKFNAKGYTCLFPFGGYCYMKCNPRDANELADQNAGKKNTEFLDSRCKGIPGYRCLGYLDAGICLKLCDLNVTTGNQCEAKAVMDMEEKDIDQGQICQDFGVEVCSWPDGFEPVQ
jgi:hypothetical protein